MRTPTTDTGFHNGISPQQYTAPVPNEVLALNGLDTAMHFAVSNGHTAIISILLRDGSTVNVRDDEGRTPLHVCVEAGHLEAAKVLLAAGADLNAGDKQGTSITVAAVKTSNEKMVDLLFKGKEVMATGRQTPTWN